MAPDDSIIPIEVDEDRWILQPAPKVGSEFLKVYTVDKEDDESCEVLFDQNRKGSFMLKNLIKSQENQGLVAVHMASGSAKFKFEPPFCILKLG